MPEPDRATPRLTWDQVQQFDGVYRPVGAEHLRLVTLSSLERRTTVVVMFNGREPNGISESNSWDSWVFEPTYEDVRMTFE